MNFLKFFQKEKTLLSQRVVKLPGTKDYLTYRDICTSVLITGSSGSGKTSGPASWILDSILSDKSKTAGLFLCVKSNERIRIEKAIRKAGRGDDLVIISADEPHTVNALEYELFRKGRNQIEYNSALDLLMEIFFLGETYQAGGESGSESERFWDKSLRRLLTRLMMLLVMAQESVTIPNMRKILVDMFTEDDIERHRSLWDSIQNEDGDMQDKAINEYTNWADQNYFLHCFDKADVRKDLIKEELETFQLVGDYFFKIWPKVSERTRAIVTESAMGFFEPFMTSSVLKKVFSSTMSDALRPENYYEKGLLVIVDISIKEFGISAIYSAGILKKQFQMCIERRQIEDETNPRICVIWADEYHFLANPQSDSKFASSSREKLSAGIYITQSIDSLIAAFGKNGEAKTNELLTNLGCQIFCSNVSRKNNVHSSNLIGKEFLKMNSSSYDTNDRASRSTNEQKHEIIPPEHFTTLSTGGPDNNFKVETIVVVSGKAWSTGERFREVTFDQRGQNNSFWQSLKSFFV